MEVCMEKFTNLILLMNVDSSKNLFLIIGLLSLIAIIAVLFIKKK
ncbi:MAG: LPXTG cell wall anchor domain-containing protein [Parvimonas micra]|uniref:LPXTG cell wall anchor domain-containing protein n=1 Tax=Parvimonas micra TaxID=33033 RepID=A0A930H5S7_9FIRM|nr:LPXTG cell wall anchor domain-containing protein [Parvimonas micra]